jgi:hypothetical protein
VAIEPRINWRGVVKMSLAAVFIGACVYGAVIWGAYYMLCRDQVVFLEMSK